MTDRWQDTLFVDEHGEQITELVQDATLDRYKDPVEMAKGLIEKQAQLGRSFSLLPKDHTPEQRTEWLNGAVKEHIPELMMRPDFDTEDGAKETWAMMGVPEDGEYTADEVGKLSEDEVTKLNALSKSVGHTAKQHKAFIAEMATMSGDIITAQATADEENTEALKTEWGAAYDQNIAITDGLITRFNEKNPENNLGAVNNAARLFIMDVAKSLSSDPQVFKHINDPKTVVPTPAEARLKMDEMHELYYKRKTPMTKDEKRAWTTKFNKLVAIAG